MDTSLGILAGFVYIDLICMSNVPIHFLIFSAFMLTQVLLTNHKNWMMQFLGDWSVSYVMNVLQFKCSVSFKYELWCAEINYFLG